MPAASLTKDWMKQKPFLPREARARTDTPPEIIRLCFNENQMGPSPKAVAAMQQAVASANIYPDFSTQYLKEKIAEKYGLSPSHVLTGNGSSEIINQIGTLFAAPGSEVLFCAPTFGAYADMALFNGAIPRALPLTPEQAYDLDALEKALRPETRIIVVCNPNNPTGTFVDGGRLEAFLRRMPQDILLVVDEAYLEYADDPRCRSMLPLVQSGMENLLILRTFSKIYGMAGVRVGYALGAPALIDELMRAFSPFNVNTAAVAGALASLEDEAFLKCSYNAAVEGRRFLSRELERLGCRVYPSQTSFVYFDAHRDPQALKAAVRDHGILIAAYEKSRVSVGTMEQNRRFIRAMEEILSR